MCTRVPGFGTKLLRNSPSPLLQLAPTFLHFTSTHLAEIQSTHLYQMYIYLSPTLAASHSNCNESRVVVKQAYGVLKNRFHWLMDADASVEKCVLYRRCFLFGAFSK